MRKKLYRSQKDKMLGGVCGGIAEYFGIDPTIIRLAFVLVFFAEGAGFLAYLVGWIIIPEKPANQEESQIDGNEIREKSKQDREEETIQESNSRENQSGVEEEQEISEKKKDKTYSFKIKGNSQNMWGLLLLIIGGIFLVNTWFPFVFLEKMWPLLIIFIGLILLFKKDNK